jgi:hypothetical protein
MSGSRSALSETSTKRQKISTLRATQARSAGWPEGQNSPDTTYPSLKSGKYPAPRSCSDSPAQYSRRSLRARIPVEAEAAAVPVLRGRASSSSVILAEASRAPVTASPVLVEAGLSSPTPVADDRHGWRTNFASDRGRARYNIASRACRCHGRSHCHRGRDVYRGHDRRRAPCQTARTSLP